MIFFIEPSLRCGLITCCRPVPVDPHTSQCPGSFFRESFFFFIQFFRVSIRLIEFLLSWHLRSVPLSLVFLDVVLFLDPALEGVAESMDWKKTSPKSPPGCPATPGQPSGAIAAVWTAEDETGGEEPPDASTSVGRWLYGSTPGFFRDRMAPAMRE